MPNLQITTDPALTAKLATYPENIRPLLEKLRELIHATAAETDSVTVLEETLKWGEPSFLTRRGSTLRLDWKARKPEQYAVYFKCTSRLIPTIREAYGNTFRYETNRAIVFELDEPVPEDQLKVCIRLALEYHLLKNLPLLGLG